MFLNRTSKNMRRTSRLATLDDSTGLVLNLLYRAREARHF